MVRDFIKIRYNKIISRIKKYNYGTELKKKRFQRTSDCQVL